MKLACCGVLGLALFAFQRTAHGQTLTRLPPVESTDQAATVARREPLAMVSPQSDSEPSRPPRTTRRNPMARPPFRRRAPVYPLRPTELRSQLRSRPQPQRPAAQHVEVEPVVLAEPTPSPASPRLTPLPQIESEPDTTELLLAPEKPTPVIEAAASTSPPSEQGWPDELIPNLPQLPEDFQPWWHSAALQRFGDVESVVPVSIETLIAEALHQSPRIRALADFPLIEETAIQQQEARFDPQLFLESTFSDSNEPVGSRLTTGGPPLLSDHIWDSTSGIRKQVQTGGQLELSQQLGFKNSNSTFFEPQDQGNAKLALNFSQPLLNGAGREVNRARIVLAQLDAEIAWDQFSGQLQQQLVELTNIYWELYYRRSVLVQRRENYERAAVILRQLEGRRGFDSLPSQIARARAEVVARQVDVLTARRDLRNTETNLRRLVGSEQWRQNRNLEFIPDEPPLPRHVAEDLATAVATAVQHRPEVKEALKRVKAASVELGIASNQLLPELNLVLETYVNGLDGDSGVERAWQNQFGDANPSYSAGLVFQVPLGNRAARAAHQRRQLEIRRMKFQLQTALDDVTAEVEIAIRNLETAFQAIRSTYTALVAAQEDVRYFEERWETLAGRDQSAVTMLEQLLDSQNRLSNAELQYARARLDFMIAQTKLKQVKGDLLTVERITPLRTMGGDLPNIRFEGPAVPSADLHRSREQPDP